MLVRFFKHKKADQGPAVSAASAIGYVLGTHDAKGNPRNKPAELLTGDPGRWEQIAAHGRHAGKYTSGALCFDSTDKPSDEQLNEIIQSFEKTLLPGLDPEQYSACWVRHEDKNRTELHFLFAGEELRSGKRLNAYYHYSDGKRINAWKDLVNADYGFADPNSPERRQALRFNHASPPAKQQLVKEIHEWISHLVENGDIENRDDVLAEIKKIPLEIARETKNSISIVNPDGGKNIRLKGEFYERDFRASEQTPERIRARLEEYRGQHENRIEEARALYSELYQRAEERNQKRYPKPAPQADISADPILSPVTVEWPSPRRGSNPELTRQDVSDETSRQPELNTVRENGDVERETSLSANSFSQQIKQRRDNNETDKQRNRDFFTELRQRISDARRSFKETYNSTVAAFSNTIKRYRSDALELQTDNDKLCRHSEKISRYRSAGDSFNADVTAFKQHVERIERHKAYDSSGLSY